MDKPKKSVIEVKGVSVTILSRKDEDYISLTDMLKAKDGDFFISDWLRNRNTVEFLGIWESVNNPDFNYGEFAIIKSQAGLNSYKLSVKEWVEKTGAVGLRATAGRYGGTFAHKDIAFEFGMWISPEFKIYLIKEFQRLKDDESTPPVARLESQPHPVQAQLPHPHRRHEGASDSSRSHPSTGGHHLRQRSRSAQRRPVRPNRQTMARRQSEADGNMRDYASVEQLLVLANMESLNAEFIHMSLPQGERLKRLNAIAIRQMQVLTANAARLLGSPDQSK